MASNLMVSNLEATASNLIAMASNLIATASNLEAMASNLIAIASIPQLSFPVLLSECTWDPILDGGYDWCQEFPTNYPVAGMLPSESPYSNDAFDPQVRPYPLYSTI